MEIEYSSKRLAEFCSALAADKMIRDIIILELKQIESAPADYFVIGTSDSPPQLAAALDHFQRRSKEAGLGRIKSEGGSFSDWILIDYFDVVVHLMLPNAREFYKLEKLWADAEFYKLNDDEHLESIDIQEVRSQLDYM